MSIIQSVRGLLGDGDFVLHECRDCGEKFEVHVEECLICGSGEIAQYQF